MLARFFIDRPIFAWVVSIVILLIGGVAVVTLPIAQYPEITPPTVQVTAIYPGANAKVVADSVAAPIEQQVNGVERMLYMSSQCTNDGAYNLTITFDLGTDLNIAQVLVQNRVALAMPQLPSLVQLQGVSTKKKSPAILLAVNLVSPDGRFDDLYLSNYATIQIRDELLRLSGVGDITYLGERDYSMRIWLDPDKMASRNLTTSDVVAAVQSQNVQVAAGQIGQEPVPRGQQFQLPMSTLGRLEHVQQFADIIIKTGTFNAPTGQVSNQVVRVRDVARIELAAQQYDQICRSDGLSSVGLAVFQLPGSNALDTANAVKSKMRQLKERFPKGLDYRIVYDTTPFIQQSVEEVFKTLRDAVILVAIVVLFFLQDWKAMILPMIDVPVSLVGTFAVMAVMGFSLNNLTLFGLVLAIGIVVDDAIVVLENVERQIATGLDVRTATIKAMGEITGPIIAITLVLSAVFLPSAFLTGISGQFYRQFALTIATAMVISAINAMTLTPSRAAAIFKTELSAAGGHEMKREALPWWFFGLVGGWISISLARRFLAGHWGIPAKEEGAALSWFDWLTLSGYFVSGAIVGGAIGWVIIGPVNWFLGGIFRAFNRIFDWLTAVYGRAVAGLVRVSLLVLVVYGGLLVLTGWEFVQRPKGFLPMQDQGYLLANVQLPDSASLQRSQEVMTKLRKLALGDANDRAHYPGVSGVSHVITVAGTSFLLTANGSNLGSAFVILEPFDSAARTIDMTRSSPKNYVSCVSGRSKRNRHHLSRAPIRGLSNAGGFRFQVEERGYVDLVQLQTITDEVVRDGNEDPRLVGLFSLYRAEAPQLYVDIDRTKCESLQVDVNQVFNTLQVYMGGYFVNLFNKFGRTWQVNLMAEPEFRTRPDFVEQLKVRNKLGEMVPLGTLATLDRVGGPLMVTRYNMYTSASVNGNTASGVSSGDAITIVRQLADRLGLTYEWTEITYLQIMAGNVGLYAFALGATLVYFVLAAKYESWRLPLAVMLVVPLCLLCAVVGMLIAHLPVDIFVQIGFLVLVGLAAKNAILIVEFAQQLQGEGKSLREAVFESARLRLRPIVMTSFAFIVSMAPLVLAEGAGAEMRRSLGIAVFAGMIGVTLFGIFLTPVFYFALMRFDERPRIEEVTTAQVASSPPPPTAAGLEPRRDGGTADSRKQATPSGGPASGGPIGGEGRAG